jgi:hypothetical protein
MIPPGQRYMFKNKILKWLCAGFVWASLLTWFAWAILQDNWFQNRPRIPSPATGQVIPYDYKAVLYVTQQDLETSHMFLASCAIFGLLALACFLADRRPWRRPVSN